MIGKLSGMVIAAVSAASLAQAAWSQGWKPQRNVELIVPAGAGGSLDTTGRTVHKIWDDLKLVPVTSTIVNRSGGGHHITVGLPLQSGGVDVTKIKLVSFNSTSDAVIALLGGHVDVMSGGTVQIAPHVESGKLRVIAVTSSKRMTGPLASGPTWPELGYKGVFENWRGVIGT